MKHFAASLWKVAQSPLQTIDTAFNGLARIADLGGRPAAKAISYTLKPGFVRTFAHSGYPFLTFYEFTELAGWCRDTYFAPDHVPGYAQDVGKTYTVWTHDTFSAYRRHIILDALSGNLEISFEVPHLDAMSWFPLRICIFDRDGLYFQTDQKLVVDRIGDGGAALTSWKKIPALRDSLPRLQELSRTTG